MDNSQQVESGPKMSVVWLWVRRIFFAVSMCVGTVGDVDLVFFTDHENRWTWPMISFVKDNWAFIQPVILVLSVFGFVWNEQRKMRDEFVTRPEHDTVRRVANDDSQIELLRETVERLEASNVELRGQITAMEARLEQRVNDLESFMRRSRILAYPPFQDQTMFNDYLTGRIIGLVDNATRQIEQRLRPIESSIYELKEAAERDRD